MPLLHLQRQFEGTYREALEALRTDSLAEAAAASAGLVKACPTFDGAWLLLSQVSQKQGNTSLAIRAATQAISRNPANSLHYIQLGRCLLAIGKTQEALVAAEKAQTLLCDTAEEADALAMLYMSAGNYEEALPLQQQAVRLGPEVPDYQMTLAVVYQTLGHLDEAASIYRSVLALAPDHPGALTGLARLETASETDNVIESLRLQLASKPGVSGEREIRLRYALAKQLEDVGAYAEAFAELRTAADLKRATLNYAVATDQALMSSLISLMPERKAPRAEQVDIQAPIFVVGMPRSGTTLVERIITSHPDVTSAGELHDFGLAALDVLGQSSSGRYLDSDFAARMQASDMPAIGRRYLERTARYQHRPRFVDKLPMNVMYAGFITQALPGAKIVELARHPVDVCLSNFKILFRTGYDYSYNLEELADFYIAYRQLTEHWRRILGDDYIVVSYESLVENQESDSRRLIGDLGLEWSDDCLRYYDNKQAAATASSAQIRQPIYHKAVGRWRHYASELSPLINRLSAGGIVVD
jgi:tetratricopeptide (TPR) repeat protein